MHIVIPMAGLGSRFKKSGIDIPKPLVEVNGKTLIEHSVESLGIEGTYIFITRKYDNPGYNIKLSDILKKIQPNSIEICLDRDQQGAADAALYAEGYIDNDSELIITNCDQTLRWNSEDFLRFVRSSHCDGSVVIFESSDIKNSFAQVEDGIVTDIQEKNPISTDALIGVHYWKHGKDFVASAKKLLKEYRQNGIAECYVSSTYNYLIKQQKTILPYRVENNQYFSLGTPEDVQTYLGIVKEFYTEKPKTIFCDLDGTILKHVHRYSDLNSGNPELLPGVIQKLNEWDSRGHKIILTTARKESARRITEQQLEYLGVPWDTLVMGISNGDRILINDKINSFDEDRAKSINVITNKGFYNIDWDKFGI